MRKPAIALAIAVLITAAAAGAIATVGSTTKPSTAKEHSVTNNDRPADDQNEDIGDLEEPFISDEPPRTAADYARQSQPGPQNADGPRVAEAGSAVSSDGEGEGWTGRSPG